MSPDWKIVKLEDIAQVERGKFSVRPRNDPKYYGGDIPFLQTGDISNSSGMVLSYTQTLNNEGLKVSKCFPAGTLLITIAANIGDVAEVSFGFACTDSLVAVQPKKGINRNWLKYFLQTQKSYFDSRATQNAQANINLQIIKPLPVLLPPIQEQTAISNLLLTLDLAIVKTEQLIVAKEKRFLWLLDKLINKVAASGKWKRMNLGDIGEISSAGVDKKSCQGETPVRLLNYLDIYRRDFIYAKELSQWVTAPPTQAERCFICKGDIFFTPSSELPYDIGHSAVAMEDISDAVYSYHIVRLRLKEDMDLLYRAYAFKSQDFYRQAVKLCEGSGQRYVISQNSFRQMEVSIPPIPLQKKIALILNTAQKEIDLLKKQLDAYRKQKRGLMQKLLTGQWRVKEDITPPDLPLS
jgi:type I restriction enzyme, S subunit